MSVRRLSIDQAYHEGQTQKKVGRSRIERGPAGTYRRRLYQWVYVLSYIYHEATHIWGKGARCRCALPVIDNLLGSALMTHICHGQATASFASSRNLGGNCSAQDYRQPGILIQTNQEGYQWFERITSGFGAAACYSPCTPKVFFPTEPKRPRAKTIVVYNRSWFYSTDLIYRSTLHRKVHRTLEVLERSRFYIAEVLNRHVTCKRRSQPTEKLISVRISS